MYDIILFDLDGTLTDSGKGIINSVEYALNKFSIKVDEKSKLNKFIGPPLSQSFMDFYGFSQEDAVKAVEFYREYYRDKGIYENEVYVGIENLLIRLKESGKTMAVATSKPEVFAKQILDYFDLSKYFTYIGGSHLDGNRTDKAQVIDYVLNKIGYSDKSKVLMIGDREHDIIGAEKNGIDSAGVLFGYGSIEELKNAGATHICKSVEDIIKIAI